KQRSEFATWRENLNHSVRERGEQEQQVQRWVLEAKAALADLQRAAALLGSSEDADTLRGSCATAQALRDARIDVAASAALDQALQAALQGAEQTQARWAEPPPAAAAPVAEAPPPPAAPAPPRSLSAEQRQALDGLLQQCEAALADGQLGAMQEHLEAIDALLDTFHGVKPGDALTSRIQLLYAERGRLKGWQQWGGGRARDDLVMQAEALARLTEAAGGRSERTGVPPPLQDAAPADPAPPANPVPALATQDDAAHSPGAPGESAQALTGEVDAEHSLAAQDDSVQEGMAAQDRRPPQPAAQPQAPRADAPRRKAGVPKLRLKAHADAIQDLRRRWKELDRLGAPANQTLWKRFDAALHIAHEPVAAQLAALKAQRQANLATREALLAELEALPAQPGSDDSETVAAFWKEQARALENFQRAWRPLGPLEHTVPTGARSAIQQRLASSVERVEAPLQAARGVAEGVRRQLIERAEALVEDVKRQPELRDAFARVRELQAAWQHSARQVTLLRGVESALWSRFKGATDAVFTQRDAAANARDTELAANLAAREALLQRLEALSSNTPATDIERTLADVDREWRMAGEPPRGTLHALEARLHQAHAAALRALSASGQAAWQATCDGAVARLALCEEREAAALDEADLAQRWAAQDALDIRLPAAWQQAFAQRWSTSAQATAKSDAALDEWLVHLEASLDLPASPERLAARRALKLRALKDTLEGRGAPAVDAKHRAEGLVTLLRSRCGDPALRERLRTLLAALRAAPPGTLVAPAGKA
ncbi:MAG: DUF349 domain-containing protein, partial [Burkholderiaceae bacterium]